MDTKHSIPREAGAAYLTDRPFCTVTRPGDNRFLCARPAFLERAFIWIGVSLVVLGLVMAFFGFLQLQDGFYGAVGILFTFLGLMVAYAGYLLAQPYEIKPPPLGQGPLDVEVTREEVIPSGEPESED